MAEDILRQIEELHSEWSKKNLTEKISFLMSRQRELNAWVNTLANNRLIRGYFTPEEKAAAQQLLDIQNELNRHKAEVGRDIYNEFGKMFLKANLNL